jgi:hypothetical protein
MSSNEKGGATPLVFGNGPESAHILPTGFKTGGYAADKVPSSLRKAIAKKGYLAEIPGQLYEVIVVPQLLLIEIGIVINTLETGTKAEGEAAMGSLSEPAQRILFYATEAQLRGVNVILVDEDVTMGLKFFGGTKDPEDTTH